MRRRKLLFRAWRRGVREIDLIVGRFADAFIDKFDTPALDDFERLIEVPNAELYAWVTGDEAPARRARHRGAARPHRFPQPELPRESREGNRNDGALRCSPNRRRSASCPAGH